MKTLQTKTIIYDSNCPLCTWYTNKFVQAGAIEKNGRVSFDDIDRDTYCRLDLNRARHEIPVLDKTTGQVLYGLDGLSLIIAGIYPFFAPLITNRWLLKLFQPVYHFISYNRRVIAGSASGTNFAPDFNLKWRLVLIIAGISYTGTCIFLFSMLMGINTLALFAFVLLYFFALMASDLACNKTRVQKWDYIGHLATLGFIEGTIFIFTALLAKLSGLTGLMFVGQGAGRLFAIWLHTKTVSINNYSANLNYVFATGAVGLIIIIAIFKN